MGDFIFLNKENILNNLFLKDDFYFFTTKISIYVHLYQGTIRLITIHY